MQTELPDRRQLVSELANFWGTHEWHQHHFTKEMTYTDGVKYFADRTGSFWLIDLVATELFALLAQQPLLVVTVNSGPNSCEIIVTDGNDNQVAKKQLSFTTIPTGTWKFYLTDDVLLLPSEY